MPQKSKSHQSAGAKKTATGADRDKLHAAALRLAARHGWVDLTLAEVYAEAGVALPNEILRDNSTIWLLVDDILASLEARIHADVADRLGDRWRDNLFELLMTRFDLMQADRLAYTDILPAALTQACAAGPSLTRRLLAAMDAIVTASGMPLGRGQRPLAVSILTAVYLSLLETWRNDDSADMAKTMAAVDKRVGWIENAINNTLFSKWQAQNNS